MRENFCHYVSMSNGAVMQPIDRTLAHSLSHKMADKRVQSFTLGKAIIGKCFKVFPPLEIEIHIMPIGDAS